MALIAVANSDIFSPMCTFSTFQRHTRPELKVQSRGTIIVPMVPETKEAIRLAFSQRLLAAMKHAGYVGRGSQERIATELKVSAKLVSKWVNADCMPGRGNMPKLAALLSVRLEWLQFNSGPMTGVADASPGYSLYADEFSTLVGELAPDQAAGAMATLRAFVKAVKG